MTSLTAAEARQLTEAALKHDSELVKPALESVYQAIRQATAVGKRTCEFSTPFPRTPHDRSAVLEAVRAVLRKDGFKIRGGGWGDAETEYVEW